MLHIGHQREELDIELEGKKLTQGNSFVYIGGTVCGDRIRRERCVEEHRPERTRGEQLRGDGGPADLKKTQGQGLEHLCDTGMTVRNGNPSNDRTTVQQQRLQVCENNWVRKIARVTRAYVQEKNGGVKARDRSAKELDRETGEDQTTVGRIR